jgi:NAD+ diphosphatase
MLAKMLPFCGTPLDRLSEKRPDAAWIAEKWREGRVLPLWNLQVLTRGEAVFGAAFIPPALGSELATDGVCVFLGMDGGTALFALDVSGAENADEALKEYGAFRELRGASPFLRRKDLAILSQAKALIDWHQRHGFCARCGAATVSGDAGHKRVCTGCGTEHFPRTDPAVIMLATYGEECLLARNVNWSADFYSALAGFVEPGESIEEAVRRELFEEAGVVAGAVRYYASQPWPFPASLMIGCYAECESKELTLDPAEIADALWFDKKTALALLNGEIEGRRGPMKVAIAHYLIKEWANSE